MRERDLEDILLPEQSSGIELFWTDIISTDPVRVRKDNGDVIDATPNVACQIETGVRGWCLLYQNKLTILGTDPPLAGGGGTPIPGPYFVPAVDSAGNISWTNNGGLPNPVTMNIRGPAGQDGKDGTSVDIRPGVYREPGSTKPLPDLPPFSETQEGWAFLVDDDAIDGQIDLYLHPVGGVDWQKVDNWSGTPGTPAGFGDITAAAHALGPGLPPTAEVFPSGPDTAKNLRFEFGIPDGGGGGGAPAAYLFRDQTISQSVPHNTWVLADFNRQLAASASGLDYSSGVWTVRETGQYIINAQVTYATNATGTREMELRHNGTAVASTNMPPANASLRPPITKIVNCVAGDRLELYIRQQSGAALATTASRWATWAEVMRNGSGSSGGVEDTGWVTVPLASGVSAGRNRVRKIGSVVYLDLYNLMGWTAYGQTLATIPTGFRPPAQVRSIQPTTAVNWNRIEIGTTGAVNVFTGTGAISWADALMTWTVDASSSGGGSSDIVEFVSGPNGHICYANGFMQAWRTLTVTAGGTLWVTPIHVSDAAMGNWTKPFVALYGSSESINNTQFWTARGGQTTTSAGTVRAFRPNASTASVQHTIIGWGTWK